MPVLWEAAVLLHLPDSSGQQRDRAACRLHSCQGSVSRQRDNPTEAAITQRLDIQNADAGLCGQGSDHRRAERRQMAGGRRLRLLLCAIRPFHPPEFTLGGNRRQLLPHHCNGGAVVRVIAVQHVDRVLLAQPGVEIAPDLDLVGDDHRPGAGCLLLKHRDGLAAGMFGAAPLPVGLRHARRAGQPCHQRNGDDTPASAGSPLSHLAPHRCSRPDLPQPFGGEQQEQQRAREHRADQQPVLIGQHE